MASRCPCALTSGVEVLEVDGTEGSSSIRIALVQLEDTPPGAARPRRFTCIYTIAEDKWCCRPYVT